MDFDFILPDLELFQKVEVRQPILYYMGVPGSTFFSDAESSGEWNCAPHLYYCNLSKANNMVIELELETWLFATEWLILKFFRTIAKKR